MPVNVVADGLMAPPLQPELKVAVPLVIGLPFHQGSNFLAGFWRPAVLLAEGGLDSRLVDRLIAGQDFGLQVRLQGAEEGKIGALVVGRFRQYRVGPLFNNCNDILVLQ